MARTFYGLLLSMALATTGWAGEIVLANRSPRPLAYQARYSGQEVWSQTLTLASGKHHRFSTEARLVVRFSHGDGWTTAVLRPDRRFRYQPDAAGRGEVVDTRVDEPGRPDTRRLAVLAVADESYRKKYPDWQDRIAEITATASNYFDDEFAIRLRLVECRPWQYHAAARADVTDTLDDLFALDFPTADLVIGWNAAAQRVPGHAGFCTGWCWPFCRYLFVCDLERRLLYGAAEQFIHHLAMAFGAFAVADPKSIMQRTSWNLPYPWEFDDATRQVILLSREVDFHLGTRSLGAEALDRIRELYRQHHHPDESPSDDPVSRARKLPRRARPPRTTQSTGEDRVVR